MMISIQWKISSSRITIKTNKGNLNRMGNTTNNSNIGKVNFPWEKNLIKILFLNSLVLKEREASLIPIINTNKMEIISIRNFSQNNKIIIHNNNNKNSIKMTTYSIKRKNYSKLF